MALTPTRIASINAAIEAECPICQCRMVAPTAIPACGHKYCFTCLKGVAMNNMGCPMCRGPIDVSIFSLPSQVLDLKMDLPVSPATVIQRPTELRKTNGNANGAVLNLDKSVSDTSEAIPEKMYWLYRGRNQGWWRFDPRNERDIEDAFSKNESYCEVPICGRTYIVDFKEMCQFPKDVPDQRRVVERVSAEDFDQMGVKGLAGVFVPSA